MRVVSFICLTLLWVAPGACQDAQPNKVAETKEKLPAALIDGQGPGWTLLTLDDFANVNCKPDTWYENEGIIHCRGNCNGGLRTLKEFENFEMVVQWKHLKRAGNSGIFVWAPGDVLAKLQPGALPQGIEIQILDHGYAEDWKEVKGKDPDWFTTHGDVFPVGVADMRPFPPAAPNGKRSFPSANHTLGVGQWNHYYIRAINGEVRLWVNGHEVSGGDQCDPSKGYLCLEAEGAPINFKNLRIRRLK